MNNNELNFYNQYKGRYTLHNLKSLKFPIISSKNLSPYKSPISNSLKSLQDIAFLNSRPLLEISKSLSIENRNLLEATKHLQSDNALIHHNVNVGARILNFNEYDDEFDKMYYIAFATNTSLPPHLAALYKAIGLFKVDTYNKEVTIEAIYVDPRCFLSYIMEEGISIYKILSLKLKYYGLNYLLKKYLNYSVFELAALGLDGYIDQLIGMESRLDVSSLLGSDGNYVLK